MSAQLPFKGLKVIELANVLAGPSVGMFFAELGANVVKIENPRAGGDPTRKWKLPSEDPSSPVSAYYLSVNYGKQVVFLDLTAPPERERFFALLADADVLIVNFRPGDEVKLGLQYETVSRLFPQLIYAHITGYGPNDNRPAFDLILQAESGLMNINGTPESGPLKLPVALIDILAGHQLKEGILTALLQRKQGGKGCHVEVSLADAAFTSLINQGTNYSVAGVDPERKGSLHPNIAPYGETFRLKDGNHIVLAVGTEKQFRKLCEALSLETLLTDEMFSTNTARVQNRRKLAEILSASLAVLDFNTFSGKTNGEVPFARIHSVGEAIESEAGKRNLIGMDAEGHHYRVLRSCVFKIS
ncbi:MAG TPA: CaiB/BaiF CoA-transferase family protein [Bacteroidia bacterium]|nr:CaiB/BaiF CoA-transferase family protein [Bacteroidia bacterium]